MNILAEPIKFRTEVGRATGDLFDKSVICKYVGSTYTNVVISSTLGRSIRLRFVGHCIVLAGRKHLH